MEFQSPIEIAADDLLSVSESRSWLSRSTGCWLGVAREVGTVDESLQRGDVDRLGEMNVEAGFEREPTVLGLAVPGERNQIHARAERAAHDARHVVAVDSRQANVNDDDFWF